MSRRSRKRSALDVTRLPAGFTLSEADRVCTWCKAPAQPPMWILTGVQKRPGAWRTLFCSRECGLSWIVVSGLEGPGV